MLETWWLVTWIITGALSVVAIFCIGKGLYLNYYGRSDALSKELQKRIDSLAQQKEKVQHKIEELEDKRKQLGKACEIDDVDWWIEDNRWRIQDLEWEIRDAKLEDDVR